MFEITGRVSKIDNFIALMKPLGLVEVARTGVAAIARGPDAMRSFSQAQFRTSSEAASWRLIPLTSRA